MRAARQGLLDYLQDMEVALNILDPALQNLEAWLDGKVGESYAAALEPLPLSMTALLNIVSTFSP